MRISSGQYVRATFDFNTKEAGEVNLKTGEVILVTDVINENWICGEIDNRKGSFPVNFVEVIHVPQISNGQKLFLATETFHSTEHGDLNFRKGEIILGLKNVDDNWWNGRVGEKTGIFPKTFVKSLPTLNQQPNSTSKHNGSTALTNGITEASQKSDQYIHVPFQATALVDVTPQLDYELGFRAGDFLTVVEIVDDDWIEAELNGQSGLVSSVCVDLPKNCKATPKSSQSLCNTTGQLYSSGGLTESSVKSSTSSSTYRSSETSHDSSNSYQSPKPNRSIKAGSASFDISDSYHISQDDNVYAYLDAYLEANSTPEESATLYSYTSENTRSGDAEIRPYAGVLYPFVAQSPQELSINKNDIVVLIQHVDPDWTEGELDGKIGIFPTSYIDVIVDCPYAYSKEEVTASLETSDTNYDQNKNIEKLSSKSNVPISETAEEDVSSKGDHSNEGTVAEEEVADEGISCNDLALVKFSIIAQSEYDLGIKEGDTITILTRYSDNWLQARDEEGNIGLVPSNYVEIIQERPIPNQAEENPQTENAEEEEVNSCSEHHSVSELPGESDQETDTSEDHKQPSSIYEQSESCAIMQHNNENESSNKDDFPEKENNVDIAFVAENSPESTSLDTGSDSILSNSLDKSQKPVPLPKPKLAVKPCLKPKPSLPSKQSVAPKLSKPALPPGEKVFPKIDPSKSLDCIIAGELSKARHVSKESKTDSEIPVNTTRHSVSFNERSVLLDSQTVKFNDASVTFTKDSASLSLRPPPLPPKVASSPNQDIEKLNKFQKSVSLNHEDFGQSQTPKSHTQHPGRPPRPKSVNFGHSNFYLNDAYVTEEGEQLNNRGSFKKKSKSRPDRPQQPSKIGKPRPVPARPAPVAPGRKITPARPAPPRPPVSAPSRPSPAIRKKISTSQSNLATADLMTFSPEEQAVDEENAEIIGELKTRILEIETDLQKYKKSKEDVILMLKTVTGEKEEEIQENLGFYQANISGLSDELQKLNENLYELSPREKKAAEIKAEMERQEEEEKQRIEEERIQQEKEREKRREKREKIISEIIDTEKIFLQYLQLTMETFLGPDAEKRTDINYKHLLGNMEEIADVSQRLLTSLENAVNGNPFEDQIVGKSFAEFAEDMKNTYAPYCRNHDEVITVMEKYKSNPEIREYFQKLINNMREYCNVFDLDALLIKPVQRILKYPLFLGELLRVTEDSHKDKSEVCLAINAVTDVAKAINEYKRRKDLVYKYKIESDASLGEMISKLNLHTLKKKSNRMRGRLSNTMGISLQTRDENFEREENRFRSLEKAVKVLLKDVQCYMDNVQESISCEESCVLNIEDFYGEKATEEVKRFKSLYQKISQQHYTQLRNTVEELVIIPLNKLTVMFNGPIKVIEKRFDKLLDYDNLFKKSKDTGKYNDALDSAKNDYEAMNAQLLDELPKLYRLVYQVFTDCMRCFIQAQKKYLDISLQETYSELDLPFVLGSGESFIETFNVKHTTVLDRISGLSFIPRGFNPKYDSLHRQDSIKTEKKKQVSDTGLSKTSLGPEPESVQSDSQKVFVIQQFPSEKLYQVNRNYQASDLMDLSLNQGTVVGVLKEQDPMGNKEKWFVDDGSIKGFIHKSALSPFQSGLNLDPIGGSIGSYSSVRLSLLDDQVSGDYTPIIMGVNKPKPTDEDKLQEEMDEILDDLDNDSQDYVQPEIHEYYYSEYSFTARNQNEVTLFEGQVVTVLAKHDTNGNTEWWLVDADGNQGYVPSNYLKPM